MCNFYNISYTGMSTVVTHTLEASTLFPRDRVTGCTAGLGPERFWMCFARLLSTGLCEPVLQGRGRPVFHCIKGWDQNVLPKALGLSGLLELLDQSCCFPCLEALITGSLTHGPAGAPGLSGVDAATLVPGKERPPNT